MPKIIDTQELLTITHIVEKHPAGIHIRELESKLAEQFNLRLEGRTLQRRLSSLLEEQRIATFGKGMSLVYKPRTQESWLVQEPIVPYQKHADIIGIRVEKASEEILAKIRQPVMQRIPVGYNRAFLEDYQPNHTYYLPTAIRQHLHEIGRTLASQKPAGSYVKEIYQELLVDLSWASSRLEGNSYSLMDTKNLIELGQMADGKNYKETQMILNHKYAIEFLVKNADSIDFNPITFLNLHDVLSDGLLRDPNDCGRLRRGKVGIYGCVFQPMNITDQLENLFHLVLSKARAIQDPFEQTFFIMVHIPYLQPFIDVNKRVSRLGANIALIKHNLCPLSFIDVPEPAYIEAYLGLYELNRIELLRDIFVWAYECSTARYLGKKNTERDPDPFRIRYHQVIRKVVREIVQELSFSTEALVRAKLKGQALESDISVLVQMIMEELTLLYEGKLARFQLTVEEYQRWQGKFQKT